jgi:hypothetical protein
MKFHENSSSGSRVVLCGRTDKQRDLTKLIVALRSSAKELEKESHKYFIISVANREGNSHYNGLPTTILKSFGPYSKEITPTVTSDNVCTMSFQKHPAVPSVYTYNCPK